MCVSLARLVVYRQAAVCQRVKDEFQRVNIEMRGSLTADRSTLCCVELINFTAGALFFFFFSALKQAFSTRPPPEDANLPRLHNWPFVKAPRSFWGVWWSLIINVQMKIISPVLSRLPATHWRNHGYLLIRTDFVSNLGTSEEISTPLTEVLTGVKRLLIHCGKHAFPEI